MRPGADRSLKEVLEIELTRSRSRSRSHRLALREFAALVLSGLACGAVFAQTLPFPGPLAIGSPVAKASSPWTIELLPDQRLPKTGFRIVDVAGQPGLRIEAKASYGNLVSRLDVPGKGQLSWRWQVEKMNLLADLQRKEADDTSVKICLLFDMAIDRVPFFERQILRLARAQTGSELPAATICYVWDARQAAGSRVDNVYSRRVRYLVLRSGQPQAGQWFSEQRDIAADFLAQFGDESPDQVPQIKAIAIGADADNTGGHSIALVTGLSLSP